MAREVACYKNATSENKLSQGAPIQGEDIPRRLAAGLFIPKRHAAGSETGNPSPSPGDGARELSTPQCLLRPGRRHDGARFVVRGVETWLNLKNELKNR